MTPRLTPRILIAAVIVVACTDSPGPADVPTDTTSPGDSTFGLGVVTSNPIQDLNAGTSQLLSPQAVSEIDSGFVYASIFPGTAASGVWASVTSLGNQSQVWTQLRDGGFDPVAVRAAVGDTIDISARDGSGSVVYARRVAVAAVRRPVLRRIDPPPRKRDVPLNTSVVIVFSEPIDSADLARAVRLYRGNALVPGTVHLLQGNGERAAFTPTAPLARNTDYRLVIDPGIADRTGDQLETGATVTFATGTSTIGPPASMVVAPDTVFMTPGTYQLTATVFDSRGNVHVNAAVVWAAQPASNFTVSATGLVTALALGEFSVTATAGGVTSRVGIHVLGGPPATVEVWPQSPTVQMGDTIMLTAIVRDARHFALPPTGVAWNSDAPNVAVVESFRTPNGETWGKVTGLTQGTARVTATSGSATGAASLAVVAQLPVSSVTVSPDVVSMVTEASRQLAAVVRDVNGKVIAGRRVTWTADDPVVATVDTAGRVWGVAPGVTQVVAERDGFSDTAHVSVTEGMNFRSLTTGAQHNCVLLSAGLAYCWGRNLELQLGNGASADTTLPVAVTGGLDFTSISAGGAHTCALTFTGAAYCWGEGESGELGDGAAVSRSAPVAVFGGMVFNNISAGYGHSCGLDFVGKAYCWGGNWYGQLGDGTRIDRFTPTPVSGGLLFRSIVTTQHSCGLTADSVAYCWGWNYIGQLGDGTQINRSAPVVVNTDLKFANLSVGRWHTCGVTGTGTAYCWGYHGYGQLGIGAPDGVVHSAPVPVSGDLTFRAVAAGWDHSCGLTTDSLAYCWGINSEGQLGDGTDTDSGTPVPVSGGLKFVSIGLGIPHTCGRTASGAVYCWGLNGRGELGNGTWEPSYVPVRVEGTP